MHYHLHVVLSSQGLHNNLYFVLGLYLTINQTVETRGHSRNKRITGWLLAPEVYMHACKCLYSWAFCWICTCFFEPMLKEENHLSLSFLWIANLLQFPYVFVKYCHGIYDSWMRFFVISSHSNVVFVVSIFCHRKVPYGIGKLLDCWPHSRFGSEKKCHV